MMSNSLPKKTVSLSKKAHLPSQVIVTVDELDGSDIDAKITEPMLAESLRNTSEIPLFYQSNTIPVGKATNLRVDGGKMTGDLQFDTDTPMDPSLELSPCIVLGAAGTGPDNTPKMTMYVSRIELYPRAEMQPMALNDHPASVVTGPDDHAVAEALRSDFGLEDKDLVRLDSDVVAMLKSAVERPVFQKTHTLRMASAEQQLVYGIVLEPDEVDSQGHTISAEEIRKGAHKFMMDRQVLALQHMDKIRAGLMPMGDASYTKADNPWGVDFSIVESYIAPQDFEINGEPIKKGSWVMVTKVLNDAIWGMVKRGEITGYSIGALGNLEPVN